MIFLLATTAFGQQTQIFASDEEAASWVRRTRASMRVTLPVVGPPSISRVTNLLENVDLKKVIVPMSEDPDGRALDVRLEIGSPCSVALQPVESGWAGWVNGRCGLLFIGSWRFVKGRVVDDRGVPVTTGRFAADSGDNQILRTTKRLDRRRGNALLSLAVGAGLLYAGSIGRAGAKANGEDTVGWTVAVGAGAGLSTLGAGLFIWTQSDKRSHPRKLDAFYSKEEIAERVKRHNARLSIVWTISPSSAGVAGTF